MDVDRLDVEIACFGRGEPIVGRADGRLAEAAEAR
jgi:hypothetical protein